MAVSPDLTRFAAGIAEGAAFPLHIPVISFHFVAAQTGTSPNTADQACTSASASEAGRNDLNQMNVSLLCRKADTKSSDECISSMW